MGTDSSTIQSTQARVAKQGAYQVESHSPDDTVEPDNRITWETLTDDGETTDTMVQADISAQVLTEASTTQTSIEKQRARMIALLQEDPDIIFDAADDSTQINNTRTAHQNQFNFDVYNTILVHFIFPISKFWKLQQRLDHSNTSHISVDYYKSTQQESIQYAKLLYNNDYKDYITSHQIETIIDILGSNNNWETYEAIEQMRIEIQSILFSPPKKSEN